jgi:hypothetical protein
MPRQAKFRGSKFEIRPDDVAQLEADLSPLVSPALRALLFAKVRAPAPRAAGPWAGEAPAAAGALCGASVGPLRAARPHSGPPLRSPPP